ncbi:MAG: tetratricopeptide repeat protein [Candidatus Zixiibacteriota bacterium]
MVLLNLVFLAIALNMAGCGGSDKKVDNYALAMESLNNNQFFKAIDYFKKEMHNRPNDRDILYNIGIAFKRLDMFDSALVYLQRARVLNVRDREINKELLNLCPIYGDFEGAINAIAVLVATGDNEQMYYPLLAEYYFRKGENGMAIKYLRLLIDQNPDDEKLYLRLAGLLTEENRHDESTATLKTMLQKFKPSPEAYANLAINNIAQKKFDEAESNLRSSLTLNPDNAPVWINLANVLTIGDNIASKKEALDIYKKYREQAPDYYKLDSIIPTLETELGE